MVSVTPMVTRLCAFKAAGLVTNKARRSETTKRALVQCLFIEASLASASTHRDEDPSLNGTVLVLRSLACQGLDAVSARLPFSQSRGSGYKERISLQTANQEGSLRFASFALCSTETTRCFCSAIFFPLLVNSFRRSPSIGSPMRSRTPPWLLGFWAYAKPRLVWS